MKQENLRLKYAVEKQRRDEERFQKLQFSVEHLTSRLHKVTRRGMACHDDILSPAACTRRDMRHDGDNVRDL